MERKKRDEKKEEEGDGDYVKYPQVAGGVIMTGTEISYLLHSLR